MTQNEAYRLANDIITKMQELGMVPDSGPNEPDVDQVTNFTDWLEAMNIRGDEAMLERERRG